MKRTLEDCQRMAHCTLSDPFPMLDVLHSEPTVHKSTEAAFKANVTSSKTVHIHSAHITLNYVVLTTYNERAKKTDSIFLSCYWFVFNIQTSFILEVLSFQSCEIFSHKISLCTNDVLCMLLNNANYKYLQYNTHTISVKIWIKCSFINNTYFNYTARGMSSRRNWISTRPYWRIWVVLWFIGNEYANALCP